MQCTHNALKGTAQADVYAAVTSPPPRSVRDELVPSALSGHGRTGSGQHDASYILSVAVFWTLSDFRGFDECQGSTVLVRHQWIECRAARDSGRRGQRWGGGPWLSCTNTQNKAVLPVALNVGSPLLDCDTYALFTTPPSDHHKAVHCSSSGLLFLSLVVVTGFRLRSNEADVRRKAGASFSPQERCGV